MTLTVGSLFAGIGGFDLGLERAGMKVVWQCEIDPFCRKVLAKHWPDVPCYEDITQLDPTTGDIERVAVLCGGFPCQDISVAGQGKGIIKGQRSSLWAHFARLVGVLRPKYVLVENVPGLRTRGLDLVLGDLAFHGYDAEWDRLGAFQFGAPHKRDRLWIVAYANESGLEGCRGSVLRAGEGAIGTSGAAGRGFDRYADHWAAEPQLGRVAHGISDRAHRLRALGNALVPQIAEWIGSRIVEREMHSAR